MEEVTGLKINHHTQLSNKHIKAINKLKELENKVFSRLADIFIQDLFHNGIGSADSCTNGNYCWNMRWERIGKTHIQEAFMALIRSVAEGKEDDIGGNW